MVKDLTGAHGLTVSELPALLELTGLPKPAGRDGCVRILLHCRSLGMTFEEPPAREIPLGGCPSCESTGMPARGILRGGGTIHCITQQAPRLRG